MPLSANAVFEKIGLIWNRKYISGTILDTLLVIKQSFDSLALAHSAYNTWNLTCKMAEQGYYGDYIVGFFHILLYNSLKVYLWQNTIGNTLKLLRIQTF